MSARYIAVNWNRQKRWYDAVLAAGVGLAMGSFAAGTLARHPDATAETIIIRGAGLTALLLLHVILAIGPLARLDRRFLPLLYNRRHLGVVLGVLAAGHATFALFQFHALGDTNPFVSLLTANQDLTTLRDLPFEWFGIAAILVLLTMAVTSHDFWLSVLTPPWWKRLHMLVYLAYVSLLAHVGFGFLQDQVSLVFPVALGAGVLVLGMLHVAAARRERALDELAPPGDWADICAVEDIPPDRARIGMAGGERVAVFRHADGLNCVSNVCKHQNGPLGEGRIIDGCITCPWHGYQFRPDTGASPPPFDDSVPTFNLRIEGGRVLVHQRPNPPGTRVAPVPVGADTTPPATDPEFYVGYQTSAPPATARFVRGLVVTILLLAAALPGAFGVAQSDFEAATFEYGTTTTVEGTLRTSPYPVLELAEGDEPARRTTRYLLAGFGKHGARTVTAGHDGRRVRLAGSLAYRDHITLLEVATLSRVDAGAPLPASPPEDLGVFRLEGEIVDSKCYTGVMNPGRGKTHRGCAARCLSGGITPLFVTRNSEGALLELIVVGPGMAPRHDLATRAGKRLALSGRVLRQADLWFLQLEGN